MSVTRANAPGKIILFGEHAVVYGRPALAAPVTDVQAEATVEDSSSPGIRLRAPDLRRDYWLREAKVHDPFARAAQVVIDAVGLPSTPDLTLTVRSTIPIASGLGSGAAMAAAVIRALAVHLGNEQLATNEQVSALTYLVEQLLHGTPSGIDNTVVSFVQPVFFIRQQPQNVIETLSVPVPLRFLVADTGQASATKQVVGDVRRRWRAERERYERLFDSCGRVALAARQAIERGETERLGSLMMENQSYLQEMTVSSPSLETLIAEAVKAGALGAKLSGAGRGGNMIALVNESSEATVSRALYAAGAQKVLSSVVT